MRLRTGALVWLVFGGLGVLLGGCAGERTEQALGELCQYRNRPAPFLVAYYSEQAVLVSGDIKPELFAEEGHTSIPSAMARPRIDVYEQKRRKDCYNEEEDYWYPCTETVEVDLSEHGTIIRGIGLDRAAQDAVTYCNREVMKAVPEIDRQQITSAEFRCEVVAKRDCPIP